MNVSTKRDWLIEARKANNMTQDDIAKLLNIERVTYARYESGIRTPKPDVANRIGEILGINREKFFWQ